MERCQTRLVSARAKLNETTYEGIRQLNALIENLLDLLEPHIREIYVVW